MERLFIAFWVIAYTKEDTIKTLAEGLSPFLCVHNAKEVLSSYFNIT